MGTSYDGALYAKYKDNCDLFLETGAYIGDGIQGALNAGFNKIISIEMSEYQYNDCIKRFNNHPKVNLVLGDTRKVMTKVLDDNLGSTKKVFFWLDAHCSGGNTVGDNIDTTLSQELQILLPYIMKHNLTAILAMDDISPSLEKDIDNILKDYPVKFLGKEPCINPYTNLIEIDRIIFIVKIN